jgi:asparaginyl-tRNA synthetase
MIGPYSATENRKIKYNGNKLFPEIDDVGQIEPSISKIEERVKDIHDESFWPAISRINHQINSSITEYFTQKGALFMPLPLTTRMISSPGAVYGKEKIDYTTDTSPIKLDWFDLPEKIFLAESSQIYLELALLQKGIDEVFANYHSFRKENADSTHLSEFHHIEYEGKINQKQNIQIMQKMLEKIVEDLIQKNEKDLNIFIESKNIKELDEMIHKPFPIISLNEALDLLYEDTKDEIYKKFTLQNFHSWEEVRLTQIVGGIVGVSEMPLLEVPFYHASVDGKSPKVADNTDIIWPGYRETIGSGHRVRSKEELEEKAKIFNLPPEDYQPYMQSREFPDYSETSGFGMGWERLLQGILELPFIYSGSLFPRIHSTIKP